MERTNEIISVFDDKSRLTKNNTILFMDYLLANGIDLNKSIKVLELCSKPRDAIIRTLEQEKGYLLSTQVTKRELDKYQINGSYGTLTVRGITTPRCMTNDQIFLKDGKLYQNRRGGYTHKRISDFQTLVSNGVPENIEGIIKYNNMDTYIGICTDKNDKTLKEQIERLKQIKERLMTKTTHKYQIQEDEIKESGKKLYLLLKK